MLKNITPPSDADPTTIINDKDTAFSIFLSFDEIKCFLCKKPGHIANKCPNSSQQIEFMREPSTLDDDHTPTTKKNTGLAKHQYYQQTRQNC